MMDDSMSQADTLFSAMDPLPSESSTLNPPVEVVPEGLSTLYDPGHDSVVADVVFIHGLGGHPRGTWCYEDIVESWQLVTEPEVSNLRSLFRRNKKAAEQWRRLQISKLVYWPEDLLPKDFRNIRILTYGYDSKGSRFYGGPTNGRNILQQGLSLLNHLYAERLNCVDRPLIFIAHNLGGFLVKQALLESEKLGRYNPKKDLTRVCPAIVFFGTPHQGPGDEPWEQLVRNISRAAQLELKSSILRDLSSFRGGSKGEELRRDFVSLLDKGCIHVFTFQESHVTAGIKSFEGKVCLLLNIFRLIPLRIP